MAKIKDVDIRKEFIKRNLEFFKSTTFVNEMKINSKNIVDLAAMDFNNNILFGFEIKSEVDTLKRLPRQLATYSTFFNIVYVVTHQKHTEGVLNLIETQAYARNVGCIEVNSSLEFTEVRKAKFAKSRFDMFIRNLDLEELTLLYEEKGLGKLMGWESKSIIVDKLKRQVSLNEVYSHLHSKVDRYYTRNCPYCGSTLYFNKRDREGETYATCYECGGKWEPLEEKYN